MRGFIISVFGFFSVLLSVTWSEPERIEFGYGSGFALNNQGVLWYQIYPAGIYNYRSDALGWQLETEVEFGGNLCFDNGDTLWVIRRVFSHSGISYIRYDGVAWSEQEYVPTAPYYAEGSIPWEPITADSSGGVWVGWTSWEYTVMACNRYQDGTWGGVELLLEADPNEFYKLLALSTDASGRVWAGWGKTEYYEPYNAYCEVAYNDGGVWSEPMYVGESEYWDVSWLTFAPDREGGMWVLWDARRDSTYRALARYWNGAGWEATDTVSEDGPFPRGAVDSNGNAWAVFGKNEDVYYSVNSGGGWAEPALVDDDPGVDGSPIIAVDGESRIWCVWASERDDSSAIYASYTWGVGVEEGDFIQPPKSTIESIYPNPFQSSTTISYSVASNLGSNKGQFVELKIFDATGREVKTLASGEKTPGHYEVIWNGRDASGKKCPAGVYFIGMKIENHYFSKKLILVD